MTLQDIYEDFVLDNIIEGHDALKDYVDGKKKETTTKLGFCTLSFLFVLTFPVLAVIIVGSFFLYYILFAGTVIGTVGGIWWVWVTYTAPVNITLGVAVLGFLLFLFRENCNDDWEDKCIKEELLKEALEEGKNGKKNLTTD